MVPLKNIRNPVKYELTYVTENCDEKTYVFTPIEKVKGECEMNDVITGYCFGKGVRSFRCEYIKKIKVIE